MVYVVTGLEGTITMVRDRRDPAAVKTSPEHQLVPDNGARFFFNAGRYEITGKYNEPDKVRLFAVEQILNPRRDELQRDWVERNRELVAENNRRRGWRVVKISRAGVRRPR